MNNLTQEQIREMLRVNAPYVYGIVNHRKPIQAQIKMIEPSSKIVASQDEAIDDDFIKGLENDQKKYE